VKNIVRIGAFHGRDDAFYRDHYDARLWAMKGMSYENGLSPDIELTLQPGLSHEINLKNN
jgi:hypothetical protein